MSLHLASLGHRAHSSLTSLPCIEMCAAQLAKPGRVSVTGCNYSADGRLIAAGLANGSLQLWDVRGRTTLYNALASSISMP